MDAEKPNARAVQCTNRQKLDDEAGPSGISAFDTSNPAKVAAVEQTGDIFKLDIDCYEEAFDYLPIKDLDNVSKTCKRLQQVAGYCFQQNYLDSVCDSSGISSGFDEFELSFNLIPFVQRLKVYRHGYQYFVGVLPKIRRLKKIHCIQFKAIQMNCISEMSMDKMEDFGVANGDLGNNFFEIINQCTKLRRLMVLNCEGDYNWMDHKYPTLEYFKFHRPSSSIASMTSIAMFLKLNPNIRKFATTTKLLREYRDEFVSANIQLDDLAICLNESMALQLQSTFDLLSTLHEHGFYKKMQLYFDFFFDQEKIDRLATLNGLNKLGLIDLRHDALDLSAFQNIEELYLCANTYTSHSKISSTALINLKRIHFHFLSIDAILPFIRRSVKMHRIKLSILYPGAYFNEDTNVIDLRALNREREQLPDAEKITLFVEEDIYLATKWAFGDIDLSLIRLKRDTSFDWLHDF